MKIFNLDNLSPKTDQEIVKSLKSGRVAVIPTDTIYGIVGSALNQQTVEKIYQLRKRTPSKPMIILISNLDDLEKFDVYINEQTKHFLQKNWPNPVSVILPCNNPNFEYLHRGTKTLAFRMPNYEFLQKLLSQTGPLVAPSANFEGEESALTIQDAESYFKDHVTLYVDAGELKSAPSTVIKIENGVIEVVREGKFQIKSI